MIICGLFCTYLSGRHGFVVAVTAVETIGQGLIRDGTGYVTFPMKYQCVVFRPFKGEILESVVTMVNKVIFYFTTMMRRNSLFLQSQAFDFEMHVRSNSLVDQFEGLLVVKKHCCLPLLFWTWKCCVCSLFSRHENKYVNDFLYYCRCRWVSSLRPDLCRFSSPIM